MTLTYAVNGLPLNDPDNGRKLLDAPVWASSLAMKNFALALPGVHGQLGVWNTPLDASQIQLKVRLTDQNEDSLNAAWNTIVRHLGVGVNQPSVLTRQRSAGGTDAGRQVSTNAQLINIDPPDFSCTGGLVTATIGFNIPSGRWYGASVDTTLNLAAANQRITSIEGGTLPVTDGKFLAKGPISGLHVFDNVSQTGFDFSGTNITSAQWLLVDMTTFTAWQKSSATYDDSGTDVSAGLTNSGIGWLSLVPGVTASTSQSSVTVSSSGTSGASTLTLRAAPAYH